MQYQAHIGVTSLDLRLKMSYKNKCFTQSNAHSC